MWLPHCTREQASDIYFLIGQIFQFLPHRDWCEYALCHQCEFSIGVLQLVQIFVTLLLLILNRGHPKNSINLRSAKNHLNIDSFLSLVIYLLSFQSRATRFHTPLCWSVGWSVGRSVGPLFTFSVFLSFLSIQLLPRRQSDLLQHCSCPPARDQGSRVSGLVHFAFQQIFLFFSRFLVTL